MGGHELGAALAPFEPGAELGLAARELGLQEMDERFSPIARIPALELGEPPGERRPIDDRAFATEPHGPPDRHG